MTLQICALGQVRIQLDGRAPRKAPKKARALMVYLAMQDGEPVSRDKLADLLWPYQASVHARHSLRNCLLETRKSYPQAIDANHTACRAIVSIDARRFSELAASGSPHDLEMALELYRGDFAEDIDLPSEPWDEWWVFQRDRFRDMAIRAAQQLSLLASASGDHALAISAARRAVHFDNLNEASQRRLIQAYADSNFKYSAVRQYKAFEKLMRSELGVVPEYETRALGDNYCKQLGPSRPPPSFIALRSVAAEFAMALKGHRKLSRDLVEKSVNTMIDAADMGEALVRDKAAP